MCDNEIFVAIKNILLNILSELLKAFKGVIEKINIQISLSPFPTFIYFKAETPVTM